MITALPGDDVILCQITSRAIMHRHAISITASDFTAGSLHQDSNIRPDRLFTADSSLILYRAGGLSAATVQEVITKIVDLITA